MSTTGITLAPRLRDSVRLAVSPPVTVTLATLLPLLLFHVDTPGSLHLARAVGADLAVYAYALTCVLAFIAAFAFATYAPKQTRADVHMSRRERKKLRRWLVVFTVTLCAVGLFIVWLILQDIAQDLVKLLASGESDPELRLKVIDNERIPGMVRMLGYLVPGSLILFLGAVLARHEAVGRWIGFWPVLAFLIAAVVVRGLVFMDRVPTFGAGILTILVLAQRVRLKPRVLLPYIVLGGGMLVFVAVLARQQAGLRGGILLESNPILLYADLGVANTALAINTTTRFSYGFNSLLGPLLYIPRGLGFANVTAPASNNAFVWDPASDLLSHTYTDFGPFGFITYIIWGLVIGYVWKNHGRKEYSITWAVAYLWSTLALLVIWSQPLTGGPDFWAGVIITLFAARKLDAMLSTEQ